MKMISKPDSKNYPFERFLFRSIEKNINVALDIVKTSNHPTYYTEILNGMRFLKQKYDASDDTERLDILNYYAKKPVGEMASSFLGDLVLNLSTMSVDTSSQLFMEKSKDFTIPEVSFKAYKLNWSSYDGKERNSPRRTFSKQSVLRGIR